MWVSGAWHVVCRFRSLFSLGGVCVVRLGGGGVEGAERVREKERESTKTQTGRDGGGTKPKRKQKQGGKKSGCLSSCVVLRFLSFLIVRLVSVVCTCPLLCFPLQALPGAIPLNQAPPQLSLSHPHISGAFLLAFFPFTRDLFIISRTHSLLGIHHYRTPPASLVRVSFFRHSLLVISRVLSAPPQP